MFSACVSTLHGKPYFLFPGVLKRWSFEKKIAPKYDLSCIIGKDDISFFPKLGSYTLHGKWKMIFLRKYTEIWYFLQTFWKDGLSKRNRAGTSSFLYYLEKWYFIPENMIFFLWAGSKRRYFPGNTWKHDASPSEEKQGTWYIGPKFGLSLNLFGWRCSTMNNFQYFVPFIPQGPCLCACLSANKRNHLSIRG